MFIVFSYFSRILSVHFLPKRWDQIWIWKHLNGREQDFHFECINIFATNISWMSNSSFNAWNMHFWVVERQMPNISGRTNDDKLMQKWKNAKAGSNSAINHASDKLQYKNAKKNIQFRQIWVQYRFTYTQTNLSNFFHSILSILITHPTLTPYYWYDCRQSYHLSPIIANFIWSLSQQI